MNSEKPSSEKLDELDRIIQELFLEEAVEDKDNIEAVKALVALWDESVAVCLYLERTICKHCGGETLTATGDYLLKVLNKKKNFIEYKPIDSIGIYPSLPRETVVTTRKIDCCYSCFKGRLI